MGKPPPTKVLFFTLKRNRSKKLFKKQYKFLIFNFLITQPDPIFPPEIRKLGNWRRKFLINITENFIPGSYLNLLNKKLYFFRLVFKAFAGVEFKIAV